MPYPPNQYEPSGQIFNGGTPGQIVTQGQYAYDWMIALGATFMLVNYNQGFTYNMPMQPDGTPTPIPDELAALLTSNRQSVLAAIQGKVYPPLPPVCTPCP